MPKVFCAGIENLYSLAMAHKTKIKTVAAMATVMQRSASQIAPLASDARP
jgi:hypothetical protein